MDWRTTAVLPVYLLSLGKPIRSKVNQSSHLVVLGQMLGASGTQNKWPLFWVQIYHSILWFLLSSFHSLERELPLLKNMTNGISLHILIDMAKFVLKWCYDMPSQWWKNVFQIHGFSFQRWEYAYFCQHLIHCTSQGLNEQKLSFLSWKWYLQSSQSLWGTT